MSIPFSEITNLLNRPIEPWVQKYDPANCPHAGMKASHFCMKGVCDGNHPPAVIGRCLDCGAIL